MDDGVERVLRAVSELHDANTDAPARKLADKFLQSWRAAPNSWRTALMLVAHPDVSDDARFFFASSLRFACERSSGDVLDPALLGDLLAQIVLALLSSAHRGSSSVSRQLASALAALAVRSGSWEPVRTIPDVATLIQRHSGQTLEKPSAVSSDTVPLIALLLVVEALAAEARSKSLSCHPSRRSAVVTALSTSPEPARWLSTALSEAAPPACGQAAVLTIEEWCHAGFAPEGIEAGDTIPALFQRCLSPSICKTASECLVALFALCTLPTTQVLVLSIGAFEGQAILYHCFSLPFRETRTA